METDDADEVEELMTDRRRDRSGVEGEKGGSYQKRASWSPQRRERIR